MFVQSKAFTNLFNGFQMGSYANFKEVGNIFEVQILYSTQ